MEDRPQLPAPNYPWEVIESQVSDRSLLHLQARERRLSVRNRDGRGRSAPPPPQYQQQQRNDQFHLHGLEPPPRAITPTPPRAPVSFSYRDRPLPPPPPTFRLGDDLPWSSSSPVWMGSNSPEEEECLIENENRRVEDPQRVRDLEALHNALMTVGSLDQDQWDPLSWDNASDIPRSPPSLGWAVGSDSAQTPKPPPYCVSQYQATIMRSIRRRSST
ncbi:hypothetical protein B7463_g912, partial [Scytalidium lignicola]